MDDNFLKLNTEVLSLIKKLEDQGIHFKVHSDESAGLIRISNDKSDSVTLAKTGLEDISELAFATAEHHPYWSLLYNGSQILRIVLDKWNDDLSEEELKEMAWYADEIKNTSTKVSRHAHDD